MTVTIAGHGKVARRLAKLLAGRGVRVRGLAADAEEAHSLEAAGIQAVLCDPNNATGDRVAAAVERSRAIVFAAGRHERAGALSLLEAARAARVRRYLMLSFGEDEADRALQASDLAWTIVRPGILTDGVTRERVHISDEPLHGQVRRYDVAAVLAAVLDEPRTVGSTLYVEGGQDPVQWALIAALTRPQRRAARSGLRLV